MTLSELRAAMEKASPGPWASGRYTTVDGHGEYSFVAQSGSTPHSLGFGGNSGLVCINGKKEDNVLIAIARNHFEQLLNVAEAAERTIRFDREGDIHGSGNAWQDLISAVAKLEDKSGG